jgi:hypothetical protein
MSSVAAWGAFAGHRAVMHTNLTVALFQIIFEPAVKNPIYHYNYETGYSE